MSLRRQRLRWENLLSTTLGGIQGCTQQHRVSSSQNKDRLREDHSLKSHWELLVREGSLLKSSKRPQRIAMHPVTTEWELSVEQNLQDDTWSGVGSETWKESVNESLFLLQARHKWQGKPGWKRDHPMGCTSAYIKWKTWWSIFCVSDQWQLNLF